MNKRKLDRTAMDRWHAVVGFGVPGSGGIFVGSEGLGVLGTRHDCVVGTLRAISGP